MRLRLLMVCSEARLCPLLSGRAALAVLLVALPAPFSIFFSSVEAAVSLDELLCSQLVVVVLPLV